MIDIEKTKVGILLPPQIKDNGNYASNTYIDTKGYSHLRVMFITGIVDATIGSTAEGTAPKLEECDTTGGTYADISDAALADSIAATEDSKVFAIDVDLTAGRKRYIQVNVPHSGDGTTGSNLAIIGILSRPNYDDHDGLATDAGLQELISA